MRPLRQSLFLLCCIAFILASGAACQEQGSAPEALNGTLQLSNGAVFLGVLRGTDPDGDALTFELTSLPQHGALTLDDPELGTFTYTAAAQASRSDSFTYRVSDGRHDSSLATVTIGVGVSLAGSVAGLPPLAIGSVVASSPEYVFTASLDGNGFEFLELPAGDYLVKTDFDDFDAGAAVHVSTREDSLVFEDELPPEVDPYALDFSGVPVANDAFVYHWEEDPTAAGYEYSSYVNEARRVELLGETVEIGDGSATRELLHDYNVALSDEELQWSQEHAYRALETMRAIPQDVRNSYAAQSLEPAIWTLSDDHLEQDIEIERGASGVRARISTAAFRNASPRLVLVDGQRGRFYSRRLHHALVRYVTAGGEDAEAVERILSERFGVSVEVPDYSALTAGITNEGAGRFQSFHPNELIEIISMLEEMPSGMHRVPSLRYLLRRLDGTPHPLYPEAPAVAWTRAGYIEFMEAAFASASIEHMHRLVIHEKSHFLWANTFSQALRDAWVELGGWYENPEDPDGWSTTLQTEFVTAYAHHRNPDEDMAETISYFVLNPDLLRSRSVPKFEFVRDHIMQGTIFISQIREDLTFEVYNLFPDYAYPGKIRRVDIRVEGAPTEDKTASVEIELHTLDGVLDGAQHASLRLLSEIGTFVDLHLSPVDGSTSILRGEFVLSRFAKSGFWTTDQIVVTDLVGNQRFEGVDDFGWKLYADNPLEDAHEPRYLAESARLSVVTDSTSYQEPVQILTASWDVDEDIAMKDWMPCYASIVIADTDVYRLEEYGPYDEATARCSVDFIVTRFFASGRYELRHLQMHDAALNIGSVTFSQEPNDEAPAFIDVVTASPDLEAPELDLGSIWLAAEPTNPEAPNGETRVTIEYFARDDAAGLDTVSYQLRDPQGIGHFEYHYHDEFYTVFFSGDATAWRRYEINVTLPIGSAPGIWGLSEMSLLDKANNRASYDFTEILHFDVE